jgi:hypothetical protein
MPTVRKTATVSVTKPVSGEPRRRGPSKRKRQPVKTITVLPEVLAKAHEVMRPGEVMRIVAEDCVILEPRKN